MEHEVARSSRETAAQTEDLVSEERVEEALLGIEVVAVLEKSIEVLAVSARCMPRVEDLFPPVGPAVEGRLHLLLELTLKEVPLSVAFEAEDFEIAARSTGGAREKGLTR